MKNLKKKINTLFIKMVDYLYYKISIPILKEFLDSLFILFLLAFPILGAYFGYWNPHEIFTFFSEYTNQALGKVPPSIEAYHRLAIDLWKLLVWYLVAKIIYNCWNYKLYQDYWDNFWIFPTLDITHTPTFTPKDYYKRMVKKSNQTWLNYFGNLLGLSIVIILSSFICVNIVVILLIILW